MTGTSNPDSAEIRVHTALHVLKGACWRVFNTKWTAGVYISGSHGRLTLKCERKPTEEEIQKVEALTNEKIAQGVEIEELEMNRSDAEQRWGDEIYDLFPLPAGITRLQILHIPDWNVNACRERHTRTTREVENLHITGTRYRPGKELLEISFDIAD